MSTCCVQNRDAARLVGWFAKRCRQRFARKGLESSQKHPVVGRTRSGFHAYLRDPAAIDRWLAREGFVRDFEDSTFVWLTRVYLRSPQP